MATTRSDGSEASGGAVGDPRPPVFDLGLYLASVARSVPAALLIGLLVGVVAGFVASGFRDEYTATTTVSVGTPARAERDAATMEALAAGMSEYVTDERARYFIEERMGEPVSLHGWRPSVEVTTSKIPGVLEVVTRSHAGPVSATKMGALAVEAMNLQADEARETVLAPVVEATQEEIDRLNDEIDARLRVDRTADTSDLLRLIYEARSTPEELRLAYPTATIISQDAGSGDVTWPKPLATGLVAGMATALIAALILGVRNLRAGRRTDVIWARSAAHRHGAVVDVDSALLNALPPLTEAAVSAVLSAGGTVVVLGESDPVEPPLGAGSKEYRLVNFSLTEPWWREVPVSDVDLGVVVVNDGSAKGSAANAALASFSEVGVPVRVAVRSQGSIR